MVAEKLACVNSVRAIKNTNVHFVPLPIFDRTNDLQNEATKQRKKKLIIDVFNMIANPSDDIIKRLWITHKHSFEPVGELATTKNYKIKHEAFALVQSELSQEKKNNDLNKFRFEWWWIDHNLPVVRTTMSSSLNIRNNNNNNEFCSPVVRFNVCALKTTANVIFQALRCIGFTCIKNLTADKHIACT